MIKFRDGKEQTFTASGIKVIESDRKKAEQTALEIIKNSPERFQRVLDGVRKTVGNKNIGDYTSRQAIDYIRAGYDVKTASAYDLFARVPAVKEEDVYAVSDPIKKITGGCVSDKDCVAIYFLPVHKTVASLEGNDFVALVLGAKNGRISSWWIGCNNLGYTDLRIALHIFKGEDFSAVQNLK